MPNAIGTVAHVAHAVAEADGIGDHRSAFGRLVADLDAAAGAGVEVIGAKIDPALADHAVVDANLGDAASTVVDPIKLVGPVA